MGQCRPHLLPANGLQAAIGVHPKLAVRQPASIERIRRELRAAADGDRQTVEILSAALTNGLPAVEVACAEALENGVHSAAVVLTILARRRDTGPPPVIPRRRRRGCAASPSPPAPDTTASGEPCGGTIGHPGRHGRA